MLETLPLTFSEEKSLKKELALSPVLYLVFAIFSVATLFIVFFDFNYTARIILGSSILVFLLMMINRADNYRKLIIQDVNLKKKNVFKGEINFKRENLINKKKVYLIVCNSIEIPVLLENWNKFEVGDCVEIHFAPISKFVFEIKPCA